MTRLTITLALLAALVIPGRAAAQTGRLYGSITDATGAVLPAVTVSAALNDGSRETRSIVTDAMGSFELRELTAGQWRVTVSLPGFENAVRTFAVRAGDATEWSPTLQLGSLQETITIVSGDASPVRREAVKPPVASAPPVTSAPPLPAATGAVRVGGNVKAPRKLVDVRPVYPADLAAQGIEGVVILSAVITTDGTIRDIRTLRSPNDGLTRAASDALGAWQFTPTLLNGVPADVRMTATFNFQHGQ